MIVIIVMVVGWMEGIWAHNRRRVNGVENQNMEDEHTVTRTMKKSTCQEMVEGGRARLGE